MSEAQWTDERILAAIRAIAHKDLPDMRTRSITEFQAEQLMYRMRNDMQARIAELERNEANYQAMYLYYIERAERSERHIDQLTAELNEAKQRAFVGESWGGDE